MINEELYNEQGILPEPEEESLKVLAGLNDYWGGQTAIDKLANMVDDATLRAAQTDQEKYQEVIVRVAGYSAHFVDISRKTQDNIIQRTVQGLG